VHVRYDGPSGVFVSSDANGIVEFHQGKVTQTTQAHVDRLKRDFPEHSLVHVNPPKAAKG
jgi:hypothetical protein